MFLSGCSDTITPPDSTKESRILTDYKLKDLTNDCNIHHDIDLDNDTSPCTAGMDVLSVFYTDEFNWSIMCCEFKDNCVDAVESGSEPDNLCVDVNDGSYNGYVFNDNGFWLARCCDDNGNNCYVDTDIVVNESDTICDEEYHQDAHSVEYNGSAWSSVCCVGGIND